MRPRTFVASFLVICALVAAPSPSAGDPQEQKQTAPSYKAVPVGMNRFVLGRNRGTVAPGKRVEIEIELQSPQGEKTPATRDIPTTITVTSLDTLARAKAAAGPAMAVESGKSLDKQNLTLATHSAVAQLRGVFPRGERDISIDLTLQQGGLIRVFVEADGVISGATIVAVGHAKEALLPAGEADGPRLVFVSLQAPPRAKLRLRITDSGEDVLRHQGEFIQHFWVTLESMTGDLASLPDDLRVRLDVTKGRGHFVNPSVHIPRGDSVAETAAELRSRLGGAITLLARTASDGIAANEQAYTFAVAPHATKLEVWPSATSALANGLDPIRLTVKAIEELPGASHVMTAAQEAMDRGRQVSFRFENGACWFSGKATQLTIPAAQSTADILLFCSRPAGALKVVAEAENGLEVTIRGDTTVAFHLPWLQLLLAVLGAIVFPIIWKQSRTRVLIGAVVGVVIYSAFFFGAVATGEFSLGSVLITATKLPTENVLAAFVLGILGYLAVGKVLPDKPKDA